MLVLLFCHVFILMILHFIKSAGLDGNWKIGEQAITPTKKHHLCATGITDYSQERYVTQLLRHLEGVYTEAENTIFRLKNLNLDRSSTI